MIPMHERMISDGITLIIRGQKNSDKVKGPLRSGQVDCGIEMLFPIEDWTDKRVLSFLREQNVEIPRFYEMLNDAPDCMTCTGYWGRGYQQWLRSVDKKLADDRKERVSALIASLVPILRTGMLEIE